MRFWRPRCVSADSHVTRVDGNPDTPGVWGQGPIMFGSSQLLGGKAWHRYLSAGWTLDKHEDSDVSEHEGKGWDKVKLWFKLAATYIDIILRMFR